MFLKTYKEGEDLKSEAMDQNMMTKMILQKLNSLVSIEFNTLFIEDEFNYAVKMTEHSIRRLTKAHIIELRN